MTIHQENNNNPYCFNSVSITNEIKLPTATIAVIISAYNQESFIIEAIESVLRQIRLPDEILISDDASDDNTYQIADSYRIQYPTLIKINRNVENLGIVKNFNKAVSLTNSEYISILNADDRYRSDFIEKTSLVLDQYPDVGIAYSDFALFGSRAKTTYNSLSLDRRGLIKANKFFIVNFPNFNEKTKEELLTKGNFIHGASLFRRQAFEEVGGYVYQETIPEDYYLFSQMVRQGWNARRIPLPLLEYRQYSKSQTNTRLATFAQLQFYKHTAEALYSEVQRLKWQLQVNKTEFPEIQNLDLSSADDKTSKSYNAENNKYKFEFDLTDINLIVFPDWQQAEELLYEDLAILIKSIINHPEKDKVTLLIDNSGICEEDANYIISDIVLNLLQQEDFELAEEANITLIGNLNTREWKALLSQTTARISLTIENKSAIAKSTAQTIPVCSLANISDIQLTSFNSGKLKSDFISRLFSLVDKYQREPSEASLLTELRQMRKQIAEFWLSTETIWLSRVYLSKVGEAHQILLNHSIQHELLTETEQSFVNEILAHISKGFGEPKAIQYLLVAMLYCRSYHLPLSYEVSFIPDWLLNDYVKYLFNSHSFFQKDREADNYCCYMNRLLNYLHTSILREHDSIRWNDFAEYFVTIANLIPLYFNEANLKNIYIKRAEIVEYFLKFNGHEVDYEFVDRPVNRKKIRLGILASHFTPSSETFAYLPVYEYIGRDFEVILYSLNQTGHELEQYCRSCANFFKLLPQDLAEQVNIIRADDLDILFIATNVTAVTNQICFLSMHRLARIQVTSGGSVVTTGMRHIDYYISGTLTDPSAMAEEQYQEKLVKLEGTAHCFSYGNEQENVTVKVDRKSLGISEETVIFVSGANFFKIIPELINTWAKIISGVPNSVLVLLPFGPNWSNNYPKKAFINHLIKVFSTHGIPAEQLIVLDPQPVPNREEVKEYFKIADVYLDSYPFAGTTSLVEPLQVNLPVIARRGSSFRSAMGAAMVQVLDVPDLVADSEESYIQLAIALGNNPKLRQEKSYQIKEKMQGNPSFLDSRSYSAKIGSLFQELLSKYLADTLSQNLQLGDINLIIFPDWLQPEESLGLALEQVIKTLVDHVNNEKITLIINTSNIAAEDAEIFLSSIAMNLLLEEDLDINQGLEISLLENLSNIEWQALLPRIHARLILEYEDQEALAKVPVKNLGCYELDNWINQFSTVD
ncbi:MAG: glycosyltransferase [Nostoc sp.]|uniref:glycosyltransferase n=1 Tax=Nostoc sp. TaxID=1180 RepID=UPI002FF08734